MRQRKEGKMKLKRWTKLPRRASNAMLRSLPTIPWAMAGSKGVILESGSLRSAWKVLSGCSWDNGLEGYRQQRGQLRDCHNSLKGDGQA